MVAGAAGAAGARVDMGFAAMERGREEEENWTIKGKAEGQE